MDAASHFSLDEERSLEVLDKRLRKLHHSREDLGKTVNVAWPADAHTALTAAVGMYRYLVYKQTREHIAGIGQVEQVLLNDRLARAWRDHDFVEFRPRARLVSKYVWPPAHLEWDAWAKQNGGADLREWLKQVLLDEQGHLRHIRIAVDANEARIHRDTRELGPVLGRWTSYMLQSGRPSTSSAATTSSGGSRYHPQERKSRFDRVQAFQPFRSRSA